MPDMKPLAEEAGFKRAAGMMLPLDHFGSVWKDPVSDVCIWQVTILEPDADTPVGNGMAESLADATSAIFSFVSCWITARQDVADVRRANQMPEFTLDPMGFTAASRRRQSG